MATINFLYRSKKNEAQLNLRLLFRNSDPNNVDRHKDFVLGANTQLTVTKEYWKSTHDKNIKDIRDIELRNTYNEIHMELNKLENHILEAFNKTNPSLVNKTWLKNSIDNYYNPSKNEATKIIPQDLVSYIDYYIEYNNKELTGRSARRIKVTKHKMERLQKYLNTTILIKEINEDFKREYQNYCKKERYSQNTQQRELVLIKTICYHAKYLGLETHHQLDSLKLKRQSINHIYLNIEEIEIIKNLNLPFDYLDNARDWLLVSCFTGQRVSDFMRFSKEMIRIEDGKYLLEFKQQKTKKLMTIPVSKEARKILSKRNGDFPRPISDQKYNDYIKEVCQIAKFDEITEGKKRINITPNTSISSYRDVLGKFEKWQLVSSHIGRRSFATNYYGKVPTSYLINITGHSSEKMFLNYIKKSNKDLAIDAYSYFN